MDKLNYFKIYYQENFERGFEYRPDNIQDILKEEIKAKELFESWEQVNKVLQTMDYKYITNDKGKFIYPHLEQEDDFDEELDDDLEDHFDQNDSQGFTNDDEVKEENRLAPAFLFFIFLSILMILMLSLF